MKREMTVALTSSGFSIDVGIFAGEVQLILGGCGQPHFLFWGRKLGSTPTFDLKVATATQSSPKIGS
jgi:hypothetical protein